VISKEEKLKKERQSLKKKEEEDKGEGGKIRQGRRGRKRER
jgi:hypothetical protein